ncbi:MAG: hypothetical protein AB7S75_13080 [Desulfococcaceae bacterium]
MEQIISTTQAESCFINILKAAGNSDVDTIVQSGERNIAVIIGYSRYLELQKQIREREERFAVYDEIRKRNTNAIQDQVESDVAAAIQAVRGK